MELFKNNRYLEKYLMFVEMKEYTEKEEGKILCPQTVNSITFENVWYRYLEALDYVLKNVSFVIDKNQKVSIVGPNGLEKLH